MCDCDPPKCWTTSTPRARKAHLCCECSGVIPPGEVYHVFSGVWDDARTYKTCAVCEKLRLGHQTCCLAFTELMTHLVEADDQAALRVFITNALDRGADVPAWVVNALEPINAPIP